MTTNDRKSGFWSGKWFWYMNFDVFKSRHTSWSMRFCVTPNSRLTICATSHKSPRRGFEEKRPVSISHEFGYGFDVTVHITINFEPLNSTSHPLVIVGHWKVERWSQYSLFYFVTRTGGTHPKEQHPQAPYNLDKWRSASASRRCTANVNININTTILNCSHFETRIRCGVSSRGEK